MKDRNDFSTNQPTRTQINNLIVYIQDHLDDTLTLVQLGEVYGYSHFHINRIFSAYVGETLGSFIRRLRLGRAAQWLIKSRLSITEIALKSGYDTPAAFSKAFRQLFKVTPSVVRKNGIYPDIGIQKDDMRIKKRSKLMEPEFRNLPNKKVIAVERKGLINNSFTKAADSAFSALTRYLQVNNLWGSVEECLGLSPDEINSIPDDENRYIAGFFLKEGQAVKTGGDVKIIEIPAGRYAVFTHKGSYENLWQTWNSAYRDWLPISGETLRDLAPFEVYLNDKQKTPVAKLVTEIYIPVL
jgi:AraC family transcriptional regulator